MNVVKCIGSTIPCYWEGLSKFPMSHIRTRQSFLCDKKSNQIIIWNLTGIFLQPWVHLIKIGASWRWSVNKSNLPNLYGTWSGNFYPLTKGPLLWPSAGHVHRFSCCICDTNECLNIVVFRSWSNAADKLVEQWRTHYFCSRSRGLHQAGERYCLINICLLHIVAVRQ